MKLLLLTIGRPKSRPIQELMEDYGSRLRHYLSLDLDAVKDEERALARIEPSDYLVVLDERGEQKSSMELSRFLVDHANTGRRRVVFLVGGPDGHSDSAVKRAQLVLSLSRMTFPHELVPVIVLEQLYRACSILRGESYHK